jgi:hypothetical protein
MGERFEVMRSVHYNGSQDSLRLERVKRPFGQWLALLMSLEQWDASEGIWQR